MKKSNCTARRLAKAWESTSKMVSYKYASARESNRKIISDAKEMLYDGILLSLSHRNSDKSSPVQQRLLRRIIEKRQAQAIHRIAGRSQDRLARRMTRAYSSRCMRKLYRYQNCMSD